MTPECATDLVLSNALVACKDQKKILLCGGASEKIIAEMADAMKAQLPGVEVICGTTISSDPAVVRGVAECDAVILVEQLDCSGINAALQLKNRAKAINKPVLGVVLH
jgi:4-hydroxy-3-methylbut-2-enyl diphosphate reductase IspH